MDYFDYDDFKCDYYDIKSLNQHFSKNNSSLNLIHLNIRSIKSNLDEFLINLMKINFDFHIIVLSETWMSARSDWTFVPGYKAFHSIRMGRQGGGVSILVRSDLDAIELPNYTVNNYIFECITLNVVIKNEKHTVIGVYRPPNSALQLFNTHFFDLIEGVPNKKNCTILGDSNVDLNNSSLSVHTAEFFICLSPNIFCLS